MLTPDQARTIAVRWRPQFRDPEAYASSVQRYLDKITPPARSPEGLERWLREDAEQEDVRGILLAPGSIPRENAPQNLPDLVDDCLSCRGKRWLRRDVPLGHADFGKLLRCPNCGGQPTGRPPTPWSPPGPESCATCSRSEHAEAGEACKFPRWHWPNLAAARKPVTGWKSVREVVP